MEEPQENVPPERNQEDRDRMGHVERLLESIAFVVQRMQLVQPVGQIVPRNSDIGERFQRLNPPVFLGKAGADPCESEFWLEQIEKISTSLGVVKRTK